jgi:CDP-glucose 4,6-dehydratase
MSGHRKVMVTGAGGFLGGWLCAALLEDDVHVIAIDRQFPTCSIATTLSSTMELVIADIEDYEQMVDVLNAHEVEFVFHLAAQALVQVAARYPLSTFKSNIQGTWNVLEAARMLAKTRTALKGIIVTSSDKAYGDQVQLPYFEDAPMEGRFPYDVSKSCADLIARSYFHSYKQPVCVTRCGNLYGGGDFAFSRIVPGTIKSVLSGEPPLIRSDGTPVRDYVYVKDAVQALLDLSEKMLSSVAIHGEAFNISNEAPISVLALVEKILRLMKRNDLSPIVEGNAPLEIQAQYLSSKKIQEKLNWKPKFDLDSGLLETIDWYRTHLSRTGQVMSSSSLEDKR